jgi:hypothetical protein
MGRSAWLSASWLTAVTRPPYRNALFIIGIAAVMAGLAASIVGFVTMFQLRANAKGMRFGGWLASIAVLAVAVGLALALVADPVIGALRGPFPSCGWRFAPRSP